MTTEEDGTDDEPRSCPGCGRVLGPGALCTACIFQAGLPGAVIGGYELLHQLGEGGMATVHVAVCEGQSDLVALKLPKRAVIERLGGAALFRKEIETASSLNHPNIVRIYTSGTHDGQPYFVMPLLEGGTLADERNRARYRRPERALDLMIKIARAVQFAQQRAVLHCDLKPGNILMDAKGEPHVSDFGLASVGREAGSCLALAVGGTPGWMSPEQAAGESLSTKSDVFCLGLMLSWLLSGRLAFGDGPDFTERVTNEERAPKGRWVPTLKWALGAIVHRALQQNPEQRYRSAAEFADDLEHARAGFPIACEEGRPLRKAVKWVRRHPLIAAAIIELVLLLLCAPLMPLSVLGEIRSTIRQRDAFTATAQAGAVMNELRTFAERVEIMAGNPEVRGLVAHEDLYDPPAALAAAASGFDIVFIVDAAGTIRARLPAPGAYRYPTLDFSFRDYFRCQSELADGRARGAPRSKPEVCVSRAFHNNVDAYLYIAFSAPLFDARGNHVGGVVATTKVRSTFGAVQMNCSGRGDCMTALLGPRDRDRPNEPLPSTIRVLAEPGLQEGTETSLPSEISSKICARFGCERRLEVQFEPRSDRPLVLERYEDPVSHIPSLAAFAPVGRTGLVVLVATPNSAVDALRDKIMAMMLSSLWVPGVFGLVVLGALLLGPLVAAFVRRWAARKNAGVPDLRY